MKLSMASTSNERLMISGCYPFDQYSYSTTTLISSIKRFEIGCLSNHRLREFPT
jgi:hypothetical protein